jgi:beta-lactamase superfamily II metal-dependent hydrolase
MVRNYPSDPTHHTTPLFTIEMLPARQGDALWIEYGDAARPRRLLVDAGTPETWRLVRAKLERLPVEHRSFELLVVTHIDKDHIGGVLPMLEDTDLGLSIDDIWFNGYRHLRSSLEPMGPVEGERLTTLIADHGYQWNGAFDGQAVTLTDNAAPPSRTLAGGMTLAVLSPRPQELAKLQPIWAPLITEHGLNPAVAAVEPRPAPPGLEAMGAKSIETLAHVLSKPDTSPANASSIVLLAEFEGRRALLCADGHASVILASVERLLRGTPSDTKLELDAFKLPHHGSRANINLALLQQLRAPLHLVSTDGTQTRHPSPEAIARTIVAQQRPSIQFNYRTEHTEMWDPASRRVPQADGYKWDARFPSDETGGLTVELG